MCGIAGYSLSSRSRIDRTLAAQSLLAGIAERVASCGGSLTLGPTGAGFAVTARLPAP